MAGSLSRRIPQKVKAAFSVLYFVILIYLVFFARRRWHVTVRSIYLVPFTSTIEQYHTMGVDNPRKFYSDFFGNILVFIPVCFAMKVFRPRISSWQIVVAGCFISLTIEVLQYVFRVGYSEIDDLILNTLGTAIGVWIYNKMFNGKYNAS